MLSKLIYGLPFASFNTSMFFHPILNLSLSKGDIALNTASFAENLLAMYSSFLFSELKELKISFS